MRNVWNQIWRETDGVLSFEWTLLVSLLVLGVVGGLTAARDAVIDELGDAAQAMLNLDNSYSIDWPLQLEVDVDGPGGADPEVAGLASDSSFIDAFNYTDCDRASLSGQTPENVLDDDS
jgi:Flp pilus assembly pilin Flp